MNYFGSGYGMMGNGGWFPYILPVVGGTLLILFLWSILWKGLALWRAAKRGDKIWFVIFLFVNTVGILEIIYLFLVTGAKLSDFSLSEKHHKE